MRIKNAVVGVVVLLAVGASVILLGGKESLTHNATITLQLGGNPLKCRATPSPDPLPVASGDSVIWTLINQCPTPPPHRQMRVKFHPPNPMDSTCTLRAQVPGNGGQVALAECEVVELVNTGAIKLRKYDAEGGDEVLDPQLEIHGPETFLGWLRLKLLGRG